MAPVLWSPQPLATVPPFSASNVMALGTSLKRDHTLFILMNFTLPDITIRLHQATLLGFPSYVQLNTSPLHVSNIFCLRIHLLMDNCLVSTFWLP